jgi:hypothetical protein
MKKTLILAFVFIILSVCYRLTTGGEVHATKQASTTQIKNILDECVDYASVDEVPEEAIDNYLFICVNEILSTQGLRQQMLYSLSKTE